MHRKLLQRELHLMLEDPQTVGMTELGTLIIVLS